MREPFFNYIINRDNKRPEPTKYERLLASALDSFAKHIDYKTNREVRLSSCTWYTPDFIIGDRLIVEVDGGIHDLDYRRTHDRIRQSLGKYGIQCLQGQKSTS